MTLPRWNDEWEKPDPLRGARGWARHHYVSAAAAAALLAAVFVLAVPFAGRTRRQEAELDRTAEQFLEAFGEGSARMLTARGRNIR